MLTMPTLYDEAHGRDGQECYTVISLTDGTTTWYVSEKDMQFSTTHIHGILQKHSGIKERIDFMTKRWAVSNVTFSLINAIYKKNTSSADVRFSDEIGDIYGKAVKIYLVSGGRTSSLNDWLLRFSGIVSSQPKYDAKTITIVASDLSKNSDEYLPQVILGDIYPNAPIENQTKKIPIVYGEFTKNLDGDDTGLAVTYNIQISSPPKYVISDHALDSITKLWVQLASLPEQSEFDDLTLTVNDSGYGTGQVDFAAGTITVLNTWLFPKDNYTGDYALSNYGDSVLNFSNAIDKKAGTYAEATDAIDIGAESYSWMEIYAAFCFEDYADGENDNNDIGTIFGVDFIYNLDYPSGLVYTDWESGYRPWVSICYTISPGDTYALPVNLAVDGATHSATMSMSTDPPAIDTNIAWHWRTGSDINSGTTRLPAVFVIRGKTMPNSYLPGGFQADGTAENMTLLYINDVRLKFNHEIINADWDHDAVYAECAGREYDSWITSRSSNYADGDCIVDPAGIVESILRDEMGIAAGNIDLPTFIAAENTSVEARINIHDDNDGYGFDFIQKLAEQSTFAFYFGAAGKARLIDMSDTTPTTDVTIPFSHIKNGDVNISKSEYIYNELELHSQYQQEYGNKFMNVQTVENTTSQAENWGTRKYTAKWQNISGASALHVANHLIRSADGSSADDDGLWSAPHNQIEFETAGYLYSHLELGDIIELDSDTMDAQYKCYGESWSGKQFWVEQLTVGMYGTKIKAIELF